MRLLIAAALMTPILPAAASAQDWVLIRGSDQTTAFMDAASVTRNGDKATALTFSGFANELGGNSGVWFSVVKIEYNCVANSFRALEYTYFNKSRKSLGTEPSATINENRTPRPGSIDESYLQFACLGTGGSPAGNPFKDSETRFGR